VRIEENAQGGAGGHAFEGVATGGTRPTRWPTSIIVSPLARPMRTRLCGAARRARFRRPA
jgi:hypothetical protein